MTHYLLPTEKFSPMVQLKPQSVYIHIPFCRRRCYYCDFPILVLGNHTDINKSAFIPEYVEVLCQEIKTTPRQKEPILTVFFGGGTPSLLPPKLLENILLTLDKHLNISSNAELSLEIDPGTFTKEQLQGYQAAGVNRLSLGVQAFQEELLLQCGRSHSLTDIFTAIDLITQAGFFNLSLDLISGLPHQTLSQWEQSLKAAIAIAPNHLSCYDLVLEPVTAFGKRYESGENPLPTDETTAAMYQLAQQILTAAGYQHYEISNYAKPGYQCRHNRVYWQNLPYYAFGMGAASYVDQVRFSRPRTKKDYYNWVENGCKINEPAIAPQDFLLETLMLGLRLAEGVDLSHLKTHFGQDTINTIHQCLQPYYQQGLVEFSQTQERLKLSDPQGFLFSNTILATLFQALTTP